MVEVPPAAVADSPAADTASDAQTLNDDSMEGRIMDPMDLIRDKFSQDCTIETVLHLLMAHCDMSEEEAQAEIDEYFRIVDMIDEERRRAEEGRKG